MNSYQYTPDVRVLELGDGFYDPVVPAKFPQSILRFRNREAAQEVGLEGLTDQEWIHHFAEFQPLPHNLTQPLALRYHGHQFMSYNPDLGDGRGFLFAQLRDERGRLMDLGTKGSGQTPYSRRGDGRLTLKGAVREVLATEMLQTLGVHTSRTFSVIETGEQLTRSDEPSPTRSAVLVRLNHSHWRIGTVQRLATLGLKEPMQKFMEFFCRHYDTQSDITECFRHITRRCAQLTAQWMMAGFVHGVLNTDNINMTGESFDYGPYRFLPTYDPYFTAAYFDHTGLYAFGRQPQMMEWNLSQLAKSLALICDYEKLASILNEEFERTFSESVTRQLLLRLGLYSCGKEDETLLQAYFTFLVESGAGFEQTFYDLFCGLSQDRISRSMQREKYEQSSFKGLESVLAGFSAVDPSRVEAEYFHRGRCESLLIDEIEAIWKPIAENDDWQSFEKKLLSIKAARFAWSYPTDLHGL